MVTSVSNDEVYIDAGTLNPSLSVVPGAYLLCMAAPIPHPEQHAGDLVTATSPSTLPASPPPLEKKLEELVALYFPSAEQDLAELGREVRVILRDHQLLYLSRLGHVAGAFAANPHELHTASARLAHVPASKAAYEKLRKLSAYGQFGYD